MEGRYEQVKGQWEERFEPSCGRWRGFVDAVVYAFLDCGDLERGFARVFCDTCKSEYFLAFSCSRRGFCPSCAAKRGVIFGAFLREEVVEEVGHCLWTFTVPKLLRPYFLHRRKLLGKLCHAAWETVSELIVAATAPDVRPGMVAAVHTASSDLRWHPHVHALASRGGWDRAGTWHPVPYVDTHAAELLLRQKVIAFLAVEDLLDATRIELLDSWKCDHTGFSPIMRSLFMPMITTELSGLPAICYDRPSLSNASVSNRDWLVIATSRRLSGAVSPSTRPSCWHACCCTSRRHDCILFATTAATPTYAGHDADRKGLMWRPSAKGPISTRVQSIMNR